MDTNSNMQDSIEIGAAGIDTAQLVREIRERVSEKMKSGVYVDSRIALAERHNLMALQTEEEFLSFYLECLREAVFVDINDYEIQERRAAWAPILVRFKRLLWTLLKFYTYRLWSQQNQVNGLLLSAVEGIESRSRERIRELESRVARLEAAGKQSGCNAPNA